MFRLTETEIARSVQHPKGYVYDFGGRRFYLSRACRSEGCGLDFCSGLSRSCLDTMRNKIVGFIATAEEFEQIKLIDTRLATVGTVLLIVENGEVVFNAALAEDCLIAKFEGPITTRQRLIPDRTYVVGVDAKTSNGVIVEAINGSQARDIFGRLHDLQCSLTAKLLVEGTLDRKIGPGTGRPERPLQQPTLFDPQRGTILVEPQDIADPVPHEVRGLGDEAQKEIVKNGLEGTPSAPPVLENEREFTAEELVVFEQIILDAVALLDRFGSTLVESPNNTEVPALVFQEILGAIELLESARAVFGLPPMPAPTRPSGIDDHAYAVVLINHADMQVEGMRRKIVFTSDAAVGGTIRAGVSNPALSVGGNRVEVGDTRSAIGTGARTVAARMEDILGLTRQNRLDADTLISAHRVWFRLEAYKQRILEIDSVFQGDRAAISSLSDDAKENVHRQAAMATTELFLALNAIGTETNFGRTTLEASEDRQFNQAINAHPAMLQNLSDFLGDRMGIPAIAIDQPAGSEDTSPVVLIDRVFGVSPSTLEDIEQEFADVLGPDGFDPDIGVIPGDAHAIAESRLAAVFGAPLLSGVLEDSFPNVADRAASFEGNRVDSPGMFI